jgi:hypothetical protein
MPPIGLFRGGMLMGSVALRLALMAAIAVGMASVGSIGSPFTDTPVANAQPSGPTLTQLRRAVLAEEDLWAGEIGGDWAELDAGPLEDDYPAVFADFTDLDSDAYLSVELHDARNGVPDFLALALASLSSEEFEHLEAIEPTGYGAAGVRYRYAYTDDGERWYGEVAAWRHGGMAVAILYESTAADACVCAYAALQDAKLRATLP